MTAFLSTDWIAALDAAARASSALTDLADAPLVLEQRVDLPDGGRSVHHLVLGPGAARVIAGPADRPDVVLHTDLSTAIALARGDQNAQQALSTGALRISGELQALAARSDALGALDDVFATVRSSTTYPPSGNERTRR